MISRRNFLRGSVGAFAIGSGLPSILARTAAAQAAEGGSKNGRVLVVLELSGGNDGLATVVPFEQDAYWKARATISPPKKDLRRITDGLALHPSMQRCEAAFAEGRLAIVQGVGYPQPNRSHFHSMDVWHLADPELRETRAGWLGRALDLDPASRENSLWAFHLGAETPRALLSQTQRVHALASLADYELVADRFAREKHGRVQEAFARMMEAGEESSARLASVRRAAAQALASADALREVVGKSPPAAAYPGTGLAQQLRLAAQVIGAGMPVHVVSLAIGGFDTHSNQRNQHANLWAQIDAALAAFREDLAARGRAEDVLVFAFSEFGRRVAENGSAGTDHGAAAPAFLFGDAVRGGVLGDHPSLTELDGGDLVHGVDFRRIYATLLDGWLGVDSRAVLGGAFEPLELLRAAEGRGERVPARRTI